MFFKDVRDYQILFLASFLFLGISTKDWTLKPELITVLLLTCLITQWASEEIKACLSTQKFTLANPLNLPSLRSAVITGLGLSLLLRADSYLTMVLAGFLAISSKFIFNFNEKHFFNPANFGIISVLTLTPDAWVSPGQWGDDWWYALLFFGTGGMILKQVGRWDTSVVFLSAYAGLEAVRNILLGWTLDVFLHRLMSGSLLLFALFMLTDPRSIPSAKSGRYVWVICIAVLTFVLRNQFFVSTAMFWALFTFAPLTVILDFIWTAPRFTWLQANDNSLLTVKNNPL